MNAQSGTFCSRLLVKTPPPLRGEGCVCVATPCPGNVLPMAAGAFSFEKSGFVPDRVTLLIPSERFAVPIDECARGFALHNQKCIAKRRGGGPSPTPPLTIPFGWARAKSEGEESAATPRQAELRSGRLSGLMLIVESMIAMTS